MLAARKAQAGGGTLRSGPVNPARLKAALSKHSERFSSNAQQDAHEFFSECLNWIEEEVSCSGSPNMTEPALIAGESSPGQVSPRGTEGSDS